jgi:hypothetical protein
VQLSLPAVHVYVGVSIPDRHHRTVRVAADARRSGHHANRLVGETVAPLRLTTPLAQLTKTPRAIVLDRDQVVGKSESMSSKARGAVPMNEFSVSTKNVNFMTNVLLPLHMRPTYKLFLAARNEEDVPQVQAFRDFVSTQWFPRQLLPFIPCLESQAPGYTIGGRGRKLQQDPLNPLLSGNVADLADMHSWSSIRDEEEQRDWIPACSGIDFVDETQWDCGAAGTDLLSCASRPGCIWDTTANAGAGKCAQSNEFPTASRCCSRAGSTRGSNNGNTAPGWVSSFADVTAIHGKGTAEELDEYMTSSEYLVDGVPFVAASIVFESNANGEWDYAIRTNSTLGMAQGPDPDPDDDLVDYLASSTDMTKTNNYVLGDNRAGAGGEGGRSTAKFAPWMPLQLLMDRYILRLAATDVSPSQAIDDHGMQNICPASNCKQLAAPLLFHPYVAVFTGLPFVSVTKQDFYEFVADYLPLIFIIVYMYLRDISMATEILD